MLAGRTQSETPGAADQVFVSALPNGKVYVAYGSIEPKVHIPACDAIRTDYNKRSEDAYEALRQNRIDEKTYDKTSANKVKSRSSAASLSERQSSQPSARR